MVVNNQAGIENIQAIETEKYSGKYTDSVQVSPERMAAAIEAGYVPKTGGGGTDSIHISPARQAAIDSAALNDRITANEQGKYKSNSREVEIIGVHSTAEGVLTTVNSKFVTDSGTDTGLTIQRLDSSSWSEGVEFLYRNLSGGTRQIFSHTLRGKLVTRHSGTEGYLNDESLDFEDIAENGEQTLQIGNNFIFNPTQVDQLAEYHARSNFDYRHMYSCTFVGTHDWIEPGTWYTLSVGDGAEEDIDSVVEALSVTIERGTQGIGSTTVTFKEVLENWKPEWPTGTKFFSSGPAQRTFARSGYLRVSSTSDNETADYYCDGTADDVQIQAAIDRLAASGGGTVFLSAGTFFTTSTIVLKSNISIIGSGIGQTIIEKNVNGEAIEAVGTSGSELSDIQLIGFTVTKDAGDTNTVSLAYFQYADALQIRNISIVGSGNTGLWIDNCDDATISGSSITSSAGSGILVFTCIDPSIEDCRVDGFTLQGVLFSSCDNPSISNCSILGMNSASTGSVSAINCNSCDNANIESCKITGLVTTDSASILIPINVTGGSCVVSGCTVDTITCGGDGRGIYVTSTNGLVSGCAVSNMSIVGDSVLDSGIYASGSGVVVSGCQCYSIDKTGTQSLRGIAVINNASISACSVDDITITNGSNTNDVYGIFAAANCSVSGCRVNTVTTTGSGEANGIHINGSASQIVNSNALNCDDAGIYVSEDDSSVSGCYATSNNYGIYVAAGSDRSLITGCRLTSNTTANLSDNGTNTTATGNDTT